MARQRNNNPRGAIANVSQLVKLRTAKAWGPAKLAQMAVVDVRTITEMESGERKDWSTFKKVADALGAAVTDIVKPDDSLTEVDPRNHLAKRLFQLPPARADFTGRDGDLKRIAKQLRRSGGSVGVSSAFHGMGGVGKTSLAVQVAHKVKDHFPDAQLFVDLLGMSDRPMTAVEAMARIIRDFCPEVVELPDTEVKLLPIFQHVLAGKRALIVLDNVKNEAQVNSLLTALPPVAFLVTSRNALALAEEHVELVHVDVLSPEEALTMLRRILPTKGTDDELRTVAGLCGRLPLALRVAGDFLRLHGNWTLTQYTKALRDEATRLEHLRKKPSEPHLKRHENLDERAKAKQEVEPVLALSARELVHETPMRAELWQLLSVFPADFDVLAAAIVGDVRSGTDGDRDPEMALIELTKLLDASLVSFNEGRYELHDLMRPIASAVFDYVADHHLQAKTEERLANAKRRFIKFYEQILRKADAMYRDVQFGVLRALELFDREARNIRHGHALACQARDSEGFAVDMRRDYSDAGLYVLDLRLSYRDRIAWRETALKACKHLKDERGEMATAGNLGVAYAEMNDKENARKHMLSQLSLARMLRSEKDEEMAQRNLAVLDLESNPLAAIKTLEKLLKLAQKRGDREVEGHILGNLGVAHLNTGQPRQAVEYLRKRIEIAQESEICDRRAEAIAHANLVIAYGEIGDPNWASRCFERCIEIASDLQDWRTVGNASYHMALIYKNVRQQSKPIRERAIQCARDALIAYERIEHPSTEKARDLLNDLTGQKQTPDSRIVPDEILALRPKGGTKVKFFDDFPESPGILLFVEQVQGGWRFLGWKAALGTSEPPEPSEQDKTRRFATPEQVASFFRKYLNNPG